MQSFFIGIGAVVASALPWLSEKIGIANTAAVGVVPDTVRYSFFLGALVLFVAVLWTVFSTRELSRITAAQPTDLLPSWNGCLSSASS